MAQGGQEPRKPRRASLLAKEVAEEEGGRESRLSDFYRQLPPNVQSQMARQSTSRRSSNINASTNQTSVNPTPLNSVRSKGKSTGSGIPVQTNSNLRQHPSKSKGFGVNARPQTSRSRPPISVRTTMQSSLSTVRQRGVTGSNMNLTRCSSQQSLAMRRSMSVDSLCRDSGFTPGGYTPRTPGTNARRNGDNCYPVTKSIKIPSSTDKKTLNELAHQINAFLEKNNYSRRMSLAEFSKMPSAEFVKICVFVGTLMMGPNHFQDKEDVSAIFELSTLLHYPGTVTKSHLKCANIPHSWPYAITYLRWLCARVGAATSAKLLNKPISEMSHNGFKELSESYVVLFCKTMSSGNEQITSEELTEELEVYRSKILDRYMSDVPQSTEELMAMRDAEVEKLKQLESRPDPALRLMDTRTMYQQVLQDKKAELEELKRKWSTYKDLSSLDVHAKVLKSKIQDKDKEIVALQETIQKQPFNKKKQLEMIEEIETFENQRDTIEKIIKKLSDNLQTKKLQTSNLEKKFYDVCVKFTVVESFREAARRLCLEIPSVPSNPVEASGLKHWVTEVGTVQKFTNKKITALQKEIQDSFAKLERNKSHRNDKKKMLTKAKMEVEHSLSKMQTQADFDRRELETQISVLIDTEKELNDEISALNSELQEKNQEFINLCAISDGLKKELKAEEDEEAMWLKKSENSLMEILATGGELNAFVIDYCIKKMIEFREIRLKYNYPVELYDQILDQFAKAGFIKEDYTK